MDKKSFLFKWLWLVSCFGTGNKRIWDIVSLRYSVDEAFDLINDADARRRYLSEKEIKNAESVSDDQIFALWDACEASGIGIICFSDAEYPESLQNIHNPPAVLFYTGDLACLKRELVITMVGTRKPSDYSLKVAGALARGLCGYDFTAVSGFAEGIDIASHLAAVRNGGKTAAVLGCGINYNYPQNNMKYRGEILQNGVIISEFLPNTNPSKLSFPLRNRILSGLSLGVVVIEAARRSGSLVTANLALGQGRDVFAVPPHDLFDVRYQGNAELLRDGAIPVYGLRDICAEYLENHSLRPPAAKPSDSVVLDNMDAGGRGDTRKTVRETETDAVDLSALSDRERLITSVLQRSRKPMLSDEIASYCDMYITDVLVLLTNLEMDGVIKPCPGGAYTM